MGAYQTLDDIGDIAGQRALVRVDFNVPLQDGIVSDATRIERALPTIKDLRSKGAKVILLSHMGRPKGEAKPECSMELVKSAILEHVDAVSFVNDCIGDNAKAAISAMDNGHVLLLENVRYHKGEEGNDLGFAKELAANGDIYVNDAFSTAHRAHASTEGLAHLLPAYAGRAMQAELEALTKALESPKRPVIAFVGGAKVSTKLDLLGNLVSKVDQLVIGGGMANTFLAAQGVSVGKSLCEHDLADTAREIIAKAASANCEIVLPVDVVVAGEFKAGAPCRTIATTEVQDSDMILDIGEQSIADIAQRLASANTVVWNGPLGAFEIAPFDKGTTEAAREVAKLTTAGKLVSVAGGGDTVAALNHAGVGDHFSYVSTAGGAFLEWLEGKELPGVKALSNTIH